jgi:curved DNA-binding protein CbpA
MNPYQILQVTETASPYVIRAAWAALIRDCHPDGPKPDAKRTRELNQAYAVLKDPEKRKAVDQQLAAARVDKSVPINRQKPVNKTAASPQNSGYPPAYPGFTEEEIDQAVHELTKNAPPLIKILVNAGRRAARGRA